MKSKFAVIGYPLGHTMSPFIHKELFSLKKIDAEYSCFEISPENLQNMFLDELKNLRGFNITIPHKVEIISLLDEIDSVASEYGAVNTVLEKNGKYYGFNTDAYGFIKGAEMSGIKLFGNIAVYGFGGAARTIITECVKNKANVTVITTADRLEKAKPVIKEIEKKKKCEIKLISKEDIFGKYDLFINASPVGMYPNIDESPITFEELSYFKEVYDIVYNPLKTKLILEAEKLGKVCGGGLSMLVCQAQKAHNIWYGAEFSERETLEIIEKTSKELERMFSN